MQLELKSSSTGSVYTFIVILLLSCFSSVYHAADLCATSATTSGSCPKKSAVGLGPQKCEEFAAGATCSVFTGGGHTFLWVVAHSLHCHAVTNTQNSAELHQLDISKHNILPTNNYMQGHVPMIKYATQEPQRRRCSVLAAQTTLWELV